MSTRWFSLTRPILAIGSERGDRVPATIPAGTILEVNDSGDRARYLQAVWEGRRVIIHRRDLDEHAFPITI